MTDNLSEQERSRLMSRIRSRDTGPELAVRSVLHRMGYRYKLGRKRYLPYQPDVVLTRHHVAVFVHGCFWHRHAGCKKAYTIKSRKGFWREKFEKNVERDRRALRTLRKLGWKVIVVWECETAEETKLRKLLKKKLTG